MDVRMKLMKDLRAWAESKGETQRCALMLNVHEIALVHWMLFLLKEQSVISDKVIGKDGTYDALREKVYQVLRKGGF